MYRVLPLSIFDFVHCIIAIMCQYYIYWPTIFMWGATNTHNVHNRYWGISIFIMLSVETENVNI